MSGEKPDSWRNMSAVERFRLMAGGQRVIVRTLLGLLAVLAAGILLLMTGHNTLALPFLMVGTLIGAFGIFIIPIAAALGWAFWSRRTASREAADPTQDPSDWRPAAPAEPVAHTLLSAADAARIEADRAALAAQMATPMRLVKGAILVGGAGLLAGKLFYGLDIDWFPLLFLPAVLWMLTGFFVTRPYQFAFAENFKDKVLPELAARYGQMVRLKDFAPTFERESEVGVAPPHDRALVDDAFAGEVRGAVVTLAEVKFHSRDREGGDLPMKDKRPEAVARMMNRHLSGLDTLTIWLKLNGKLPATTVVRHVGAGAALRPPAGLQAVRLEDPEFDSVYHVFGSDQVGARALLTPKVMRALLTMADDTGLLPPALLAEGDRMALVLANPSRRDLFEPGPVTRPGLDLHLRRIEADIAAAFGLISTLLDVAERTPGGHVPPLSKEPSS